MGLCFAQGPRRSAADSVDNERICLSHPLPRPPTVGPAPDRVTGGSMIGGEEVGAGDTPFPPHSGGVKLTRRDPTCHGNRSDSQPAQAALHVEQLAVLDSLTGASKPGYWNTRAPPARTPMFRYNPCMRTAPKATIGPYTAPSYRSLCKKRDGDFRRWLDQPEATVNPTGQCRVRSARGNRESRTRAAHARVRAITERHRSH